MSVTQNQVDEVRGYLLGLQDSICAGIETEDGTSAFRRDTWQRPEGGGGESPPRNAEGCRHGGHSGSRQCQDVPSLVVECAPVQ